MTTTLAAKNASIPVDETPVPASRPSLVRRAVNYAATPIAKAAPKAGVARRPKVPVFVWSVLIRAVSIFGIYAMLIAVLFWFIPTLGSFIHLNSGLARVDGDLNGTLVLFIAPFAFALVLLAVAFLRIARGVWRLGSSLIARIKNSREAVEVSLSAAPQGLQDRTKTKATSSTKGKK